VQLTIWSRQALDFSAPLESIIAVKGVKVSDFNGRSLSLFSASMMLIDPDMEQAHTLSGWYKNVGRNESFSNQGQVAMQVKDEGLGMRDTPDYFSAVATVVFIRQDNISYPACRTDGCRKKVVEDGSGHWRCERCDKTWDTPCHRYPIHPPVRQGAYIRYIMTVSVNDHTAQLWLNLFDEVGKKVLGLDADALVEQKETDTAKALETFNAATFVPWVWRVRAKQDNYQGQVRVRYQAMDVFALDYKTESRRLIKLIQSY
jgi:replication factor A1